MKTKKTQEKRKVENLENEIWKIVPTTNRYFASNLGRVKKVNKRGEFIQDLRRIHLCPVAGVDRLYSRDNR